MEYLSSKMRSSNGTKPNIFTIFYNSKKKKNPKLISTVMTHEGFLLHRFVSF